MSDQDLDDRFRVELTTIAMAAPAYDPHHVTDEAKAGDPSRWRHAWPYALTVAAGASAAAILVGTGLWDPRTNSDTPPASDAAQESDHDFGRVQASQDRDPLTSGDESNVEALHGASEPGPRTVQDLKHETVIIGDVIASERQSATGPPDDIWYPVYVTIRIHEQLTGDLDLPQEITYWTQFITDDDLQIVLEGTPWLNPGDRVLTSVMEENGEPALFTSAGNWTTYEIVDDRITLAARLQSEKTSGSAVIPPLADELVGLTEDQAADLIRD